LRVIVISLLVLIFFKEGLAIPSGPNNAYTIIYDLKYDWLEYNKDLKVYIPHIKENNSNKIIYSLRINFNDYPGCYLLLKSQNSNDYLFFGSKMKQVLPKDEWVKFSYKDLSKVNNNAAFILSIYGDKNPENHSVFFGFPFSKASNIRKIKANNFLDFSPRSFSSIQSSLVVFFLFCLIMMSFLTSNFSKAYKKFYSINDMLSFKIKETSFLVNKPMDRPNMMIVILLSMFSSFVFILCQSKGFDILSNNFIFQNGDSFGVLTSNFFKLTIIIFVLYIAKYFLINTIGSLFNIEKIVDIHYFKLIQISLVFFTIVLVILLISYNAYFGNVSNFKNLFTVILLFFYSIRALIIYFSINQTGNIKTLYLISYLCIVEILPVLIGMRLII
jgi:hypothetical protein